MRFGRMCLRNGVIRHSVGIFKCDNITGQRRGITWNALTQHVISKLYSCKLYYSPDTVEKILHLLCLYSRPQPLIARLPQVAKSSSHRNDKQPSVTSQFNQVLRIYKSKLHFTGFPNVSFSCIPCAFCLYIILSYRYLVCHGLQIFVITFFCVNFALISIKLLKKNKVTRKKMNGILWYESLAFYADAGSEDGGGIMNVY